MKPFRRREPDATERRAREGDVDSIFAIRDRVERLMREQRRLSEPFPLPDLLSRHRTTERRAR